MVAPAPRQPARLHRHPIGYSLLPINLGRSPGRQTATTDIAGTAGNAQTGGIDREIDAPGHTQTMKMEHHRMAAEARSGAQVGALEWVEHLGGERVLGGGVEYCSALHVGRYRFPGRPDRFTAPPLERHYISITVDGATEVERNLSGGEDRARFAPGNSLIMAAGQPNAWRWTRPTEEIHFYLCPEFLREIARKAGLDDVRLIDRFAFADPELQRMATALLRELSAPGIASRLWVESVTNELYLHILRQHCIAVNTDPSACSGLTAAQLRRVSEFVSKNLSRDMTLADMAEVAGVSRFHFAHMFKRSVGEPPHRWLVQHRLERAKALLRSTDLSITEVAFEVGYQSQSHFGQMFRRATGMTPRSWRKASGN